MVEAPTAGGWWGCGVGWGGGEVGRKVGRKEERGFKKRKQNSPCARALG